MEENVPPVCIEETIIGPFDSGKTGEAPPFRTLGQPIEKVSPSLLGLPNPGTELGDFELLRVLGNGSFARVYLAKQISLGRFVALKVSRNQSQEAKTLASLEHPHIVNVFFEAIDEARGLRLLCMQYVAGTTLERIIVQMRQVPMAERSGRCILDLIDAQSTNPAALDIGALRDREALMDMDLIEAACWIGARLAEALAHAHEQGVKHRDIKPANILVNRYGRPLLADFNIATSHTSNQPLGGTLAYMAAEHLDAFNNDDFTPAHVVDETSDVWSLGAVIYELLTGELPFPVGALEGNATDVYRRLSDERKLHPPRLAPLVDASPTLERVMAKCLAPRQADRYQSAVTLAADLDSCRELRRVHREMPPGGRVTQWCRTSPFLLGTILMLLPHVAASIVNITYNNFRIVHDATSEQKAVFLWLILFYNAIAWPLSVAAIVRLVYPLYKTWRTLVRGDPIETAAVDEVRRRTLMMPVWAMWMAFAAWLPGGLVFPLGLHLFGGFDFWDVLGHFLLSFTLSGLIAITYSVLAFDFVVIRVLYPGLWLEARQLHRIAREELSGHERWLFAVQLSAVLIPLVGAALLVIIGPGGDMVSNYQTFSYLVTGFLALGMAGQGMALLTDQHLRETIAVLVASGRKEVRK